MAGSAGVAPGPLTYGELSLMAEGRDAAQWWHTATLRSTIYAVVGIKRTPAELNPIEQERHRPKTKEQLERAAEIRANVAAARDEALAKLNGGR